MAGELENSPDARLQLAIALIKANPEKYGGRRYTTTQNARNISVEVKAILRELDKK